LVNLYSTYDNFCICLFKYIFNLIENGEKMHIWHCMLHYFHRRKSTTETSRIICKTYAYCIWKHVRILILKVSK